MYKNAVSAGEAGPACGYTEPSRQDVILPTNPDEIKDLWQKVSSAAAMSSRGNTSRSRGQRTRGRGGLTPSEEHSAPGSHNTNSIVLSAFSHFGTSEPPDGETADHYRGIPGLGGVNIWVALDDGSIRDIAAEYREMRGLGLCEKEFATFAKERFLRGEPRARPVSEDRQWRSERMLQLVCPPEEGAHWHVPPLLDGAAAVEADWTWDIRPGCSYWPSLRGFNRRYKAHVQNCTFVRSRITCPYFTVEFKREGEAKDAALRQVCAAGALALFNRHRLYAEARRAIPDLIDDLLNVRHYALTLAGPDFIFWLLHPTLDESGGRAGYETTWLFGDD